MTQEERDNLGNILGIMAVFYGRNDLSRPVISMYLDDLAAELTFSQAIEACTRYRRDKRNTRFPLPAQLIEAVKPAADPKALANVLTRKIENAVAHHGYTWEAGFDYQGGRYWEARVDGKTKTFATFREAVIAELGEIAWHAICQRGGWMAVRNSMSEMNEGTFVAQMRDQIEATIQLAKSGVDVTQIGMPAPRREGGDLERIGDAMKVLEFTPRRLEDSP